MTKEKPRWLVTRKTVEELFAEGVPLDFINSSMLSVLGREMEIEAGPPEEGALLLCVPLAGRSLAEFPASAVGACETCGQAIVFRLTAPTTLKRICIPCGAKAGLFDR